MLVAFFLMRVPLPTKIWKTKEKGTAIRIWKARERMDCTDDKSAREKEKGTDVRGRECSSMGFHIRVLSAASPLLFWAVVDDDLFVFFMCCHLSSVSLCCHGWDEPQGQR
jgi:hypothetical protein